MTARLDVLRAREEVDFEAFTGGEPQQAHARERGWDRLLGKSEHLGVEPPHRGIFAIVVRRGDVLKAPQLHSVKPITMTAAGQEARRPGNGAAHRCCRSAPWPWSRPRFCRRP